jgi:hypothetical protein
MKGPSKSWRQARLFAQQAADDLPEGVERRVPTDVAMAQVLQDQMDGRFYNPQGNLKPEPRPDE